MTKDEDAYKSAINMLKSIETLFNVTGVVGLPARTMVPEKNIKTNPTIGAGTHRRRRKGGGL